MSRAGEAERWFRRVLPGLAQHPTLFPYALDLERGLVLLVELDEQDYRNAAFLDERCMTESMQAQQHEIDMIATAVEEMSASISEVARSAAQASHATEETNQRANAGQRAVELAIASTDKVAEGMRDSIGTIQSLQQDSQTIGSVLGLSAESQIHVLGLRRGGEQPGLRGHERARGFSGD